MEDPTREDIAEEEDPADEIRRMQRQFREEYEKDRATCMELGQLRIYGLGFNMTVI